MQVKNVHREMGYWVSWDQKQSNDSGESQRTETIDPVNQLDFKTNTCSLRKARENE